jgi:polysaccharide export outer membrane protein
MRLLRRVQYSLSRGVGIVILAAGIAGCGTNSPTSTSKNDPKDPKAPPSAITDTLRVNDRVKIDITGTPETIEANDYEIAADGTIKLHFAGNIQAVGKTPDQLAKDIQDALVPKYYAHANVVVLSTGRYAYIGGEINPGKEGRIVIAGQMTLTGLIDTAGGFNAFANRSKVQITRVDGTVLTVNYRKAVRHPELDPPIYPGDRIYIPRRF